VKQASLLVLLFVGLTTGAAATEQEELASLRNRIGSLQKELERTTESKSEAADALRESEMAISDSNRRLRDLGRRQQNAGDDLARLQEQSSRLKKDMRALEANLADLLYAQYLGGRQEYLELLLGNGDPNQAARDLQYYGYIARNRAAWLSALRGNLAQLDAISAQLKQKSDELTVLRNDAARQQSALEQDRRIRQQLLQRISARIRLQNREMERLQRNENRLSQLVEKLARMFAQSNASPFESLKGKLAMPVKGKVSNKFGARRPDGAVAWKGWFLRTPSGQEVRAVAAGKVVFADWLRGFGNLLIIDHGKGYMSLYGNNETLYKQVGDTLRGGDVIAAAGNSGGNEDSGLYFELRHEGKPLDPAKWVATR